VTKNRGFDSRHGHEIFFFSKASTPTPAHIQPPIKRVTTAFPTGKSPECKPNHSSPSSAEVTNECNYTQPQAPTAWNGNLTVTNIRNWTAIHPLKTSKY